MVKIVPLHLHPTFYQPCADILNEEWPRSRENRLHTLQKSCNELPCSLILLTDIPENNASLIGHSRLCPVVGIQQACLVESVVVKKSLRGQGYGRMLMDATEIFAKQTGLTVMFLTTHDKQKFYAHLGYGPCAPVVSLGSNVTAFTQKIVESLFGKGCMGSPVSNDENKVNQREKSPDALSASQVSTTPGSNFHTTSKSSLTSTQLPHSSPPLPPPPPPPPLLPPPCNSQAYSSTDRIHVARMDPSLVSWMKKVL